MKPVTARPSPRIGLAHALHKGARPISHALAHRTFVEIPDRFFNDEIRILGHKSQRRLLWVAGGPVRLGARPASNNFHNAVRSNNVAARRYHGAIGAKL